MQEHCILASIANMIRNPCESSRNVTNRGLEAAEMQVLKGGHQLRQMGRAARMARGARARAFTSSGRTMAQASKEQLRSAYEDCKLLSKCASCTPILVSLSVLPCCAASVSEGTTDSSPLQYNLISEMCDF